MQICVFCSKECKSKNSRVQHQRFCVGNPDRVAVSRNIQKVKRSRLPCHDDPVWREKQRQKRLENIANGLRHTDETKAILSAKTSAFYSDPSNRKRHSDVMKQAVIDHADSYTKNNVVGRVRNIEFNGYLLKGSWELVTAQALDAQSICWVQPETGLPYEWKNGTHLYFPDFYLPEYDVYIEVKGYERERDRAKWETLKNLMVIKEAGIKRLKNNDISWIMDHISCISGHRDSHEIRD